MNDIYYTKSCIGIKIPYSKLFKIKTRGCSHSLPTQKKAKFCMFCGKRLWINNKELNEKDNKLYGFDFFTNSAFFEKGNPKYAFIGVIIKTFYGNPPTVQKLPDLYIKNMKSIKSDLKRALTPLKLWKEKDFGVWIVMLTE